MIHISIYFWCKITNFFQISTFQSAYFCDFVKIRGKCGLERAYFYLCGGNLGEVVPCPVLVQQILSVGGLCNGECATSSTLISCAAVFHRISLALNTVLRL